MPRQLAASILPLLLGSAVAARGAQVAEPATTFRVFLTDGQTLPSYGEAAVAGERVVFMLPVGGEDKPLQLQLMSLPLPSVDVPRTVRYAESVRAAQYAATRGESDYAAMTNEVSRAIDRVKAEADPKKRLAMAEDARRRLIDWSRDNYGYRAADIQQLAGLFDEIIVQLRAAAGESKFSVDLAAGPAAPRREVLLPAPGLVESIQLALSAAAATDLAADREAILRTALAVAATAAGAEGLRVEAGRRLADEMALDGKYRSLAAEVVGRADAAVQRADLAELDALRIEALGHDLALGSVRSDALQSILAQLDARREAVRARRAALARYAAARPLLAAYDRRLRPILAALDDLTPVLGRVRDLAPVSFARVKQADARVQSLARDLARLTPPPDAQDVHHTLASALAFARAACGKRAEWSATRNEATARDASAAASGALLLSSQARQDLADRLRPPRRP